MLLKIVRDDVVIRANGATNGKNLGTATPGEYEIRDTKSNDGSPTWFQIDYPDSNSDAVWVSADSEGIEILEGTTEEVTENIQDEEPSQEPEIVSSVEEGAGVDTEITNGPNDEPDTADELGQQVTDNEISSDFLGTEDSVLHEGEDSPESDDAVVEIEHDEMNNVAMDESDMNEDGDTGDGKNHTQEVIQPDVTGNFKVGEVVNIPPNTYHYPDPNATIGARVVSSLAIIEEISEDGPHELKLRAVNGSGYRLHFGVNGYVNPENVQKVTHVLNKSSD